MNQAPTIRDVLGGDVLLVHEPALAHRAAVPSKAAPSAGGGVAVVSVMGPILQRGRSSYYFGDFAGYDSIEAAFSAALASPEVDSIVLHLDSPGGVAAGCFEAVERMRAARAASGKPVVAFADEMAASAAYALACIANAGIVVPRSGEVGSVGVIAVHATMHRMLAEDGIDARVFRSGKRKAEGSSFEALSKEAAAAMQDRVDALASQFGELVGKARGKSKAEVLGLEGVLLGADAAVRAGLADQIGTFRDAVALARSAAPKKPAAVVAPRAAVSAKTWADYTASEKAKMQADPAQRAELFRLLAEHRAANGTAQRIGIAARKAVAPQPSPATSTWGSMSLEARIALATSDVHEALRLQREHKKLAGAEV